MIYLFVFFAILAPSANAVMDVLKDQFSKSIFKDKDPKFWEANVSYLYHPVNFGVHWDAWHYAKYFMLIGIWGQIICAYFCPWWVVFISIVSWSVVFDRLYSKYLRA